MQKFRFKTEKEFKNEFGSNWRRKIRSSWIEEMDYLLGKKVPKNIVRDILEEGISFRGENGTNFAFSRDMITPIREKPARGRIIVITGSSFGNIKGTITKILHVEDNNTVLTEAIHPGDSFRYYLNKPAWYEKHWRYADEEEKEAWRKGKHMSPKFDKTYKRFL